MATNLSKISDAEIHENSSGGSRAVPCRWTDMTKLIVAFRDWFATPPPPLIKRSLIVPAGVESN